MIPAFTSSQGTGFVKNWGQLVGLRVLLGVLEAGYFPGCVYLLSCWYTRCTSSFPFSSSPLMIGIDEVQQRYSIFYLIGCVASALSGILAFGLMQLNGMHGLGGWRWIFILEGVVCCAAQFLKYITPDARIDYRCHWNALFCLLGRFPRSRCQILEVS